MEDELEQTVEDKESGHVQVDFIKIRGVLFMQDDQGWPSVGDWVFEFFPTYAERFGMPRTVSNIAQRWRIQAGSRKDAVERFVCRAAENGIERAEIACVSQIEAILNIEQGALYGQAKPKAG